MRDLLFRKVSRLLVVASTLATLQLKAASIPSDRLPASGWSGNVGIPGGIPTDYSQFCNVRVKIPGSNLIAKGDGVTDDTAAIQAAVSLCPDKQYVYVPAGNYKLTSQIARQGVNNYDNVQHPFSIVIRGDGPSLTKFYSYSSSGSIFAFSPAISQGAGATAITSGNTRGSTAIVTSNVPGGWLQAGRYMVILRGNTASGAVNAASYMTDAASQIVKVLAVDPAAKKVTFTPALNEGYSGDRYGVSISPPYRCGLENMYIERVAGYGGSHNILISSGEECWVKNVESYNAQKWHVRLERSANCEIRECYTHDGPSGGGDSIYGFGLYQWSCNNLVENNIGKHCRHTLILEYGGQNNVFGYNYSLEPINENQLTTDYLMGDIINHGESRYNLWEGNVAATIRFDGVLGGGLYNTAFRNRIQRKGLPSTYVACFGSDVQRWNYYTNLVGNIYEVPPTKYSGPVRRWGTNQDDASTIDAKSQSTAYLDGEVDLVSGSTVWNSSDHSLPDSYYLKSKPSFLADTLTLPLFGPDTVSTLPSALTAVSRYLTTQITPTLAAPANVRVAP